MCGFGISSFGVRHGDSYCGDVWFGVHWALEGRAILHDLFFRGRDETTPIMSGLELVVWDIEEDREDRSVHPQHIIVN